MNEEHLKRCTSKEWSATRLHDSHVEVICADATEMPLPDRVSGAVCLTMLHHLPSVELQDQLLAEVRRVLRPGGRL